MLAEADSMPSLVDEVWQECNKWVAWRCNNRYRLRCNKACMFCKLP